MHRIVYWLHYDTDSVPPKRRRRSYGPDKGAAIKVALGMPAWRNSEVVAVTTLTVWPETGNPGRP